MGAHKTAEEKQITRDARNLRRGVKRAAEKAVAAEVTGCDPKVQPYYQTGAPAAKPNNAVAPSISGGNWYK